MKKQKKRDELRELPGATAWPFERRCPECGKVFCCTVIEDWIYWDRDEMLCSWGCKRRREKAAADAEARRKAAQRNLTPRQREAMVRRLAMRGETDEQIAQQLGMKRQHVRYYRRKIEDSWKDDE